MWLGRRVEGAAQCIIAPLLYGLFFALGLCHTRATMIDTDDDSTIHIPGRLNPEFLQTIGLIARDWGALEYLINQAIWRLSNTYPALGACVTAQIFTVDGRLKALASLLKIRRADKKLIDRLNKFTEAVRTPTVLRNRNIHDLWATSVRDKNTAYRIQITAQHKLSFERIEVTIDSLKSDHKKIHECLKQFGRIHDAILAAAPTLPGIPRGELIPMYPVHKPTLTTDEK